MQQEQLEYVQDLFEPVKQELGPYLKGIYIYGSAARKERVEGSDIDVLILVDDTKKDFGKKEYSRAKQLIEQIADEEEELDLHIQPPKPLSRWWDLIISGEPWAVTSMKDAQPVYDPSEYITLTKRLLHEGEMRGTYQRAHKLMKRSRKKIKKMKTLMLEDVTSELLKAMTEAAQAVLMYYGNPPPSPAQVGDELERIFVEDMELLSPRAVDDYRDFYNLTERIDHGKQSEFTGRELDQYIDQSLAFIKAMSALFEKLEKEKQERVIEQSHSEALQICKEALQEKGVEVPTDDQQILQRFRAEFVEEGLVSDDHLDLLEGIMQNKEALEEGDIDDLSESQIYSSRAYLRDFESAVKHVLSRDEMPEMLEEAEEVESEALGTVKDYCDDLLDEYEEVIKAIWMLSVDEVKDTKDLTLVILYNDLVDRGISRQELQDEAQRLRRETLESENISIHPLFYDLTDYWNLVRHGSPITFSEIREGMPVYDPSGFFLPLKKLLKKGKIPGTKEAMRSLIAKAPKRALKVKKKYKSMILEQLYNAVVDAGQAALITRGVAPPVQKKLPETLRTHLLGEGHISERTIQYCEDVIQYWKDYEHGDIQEISGEDIDDLMDKTGRFLDVVDDLLDMEDTF